MSNKTIEELERELKHWQRLNQEKSERDRKRAIARNEVMDELRRMPHLVGLMRTGTKLDGNLEGLHQKLKLSVENDKSANRPMNDRPLRYEDLVNGLTAGYYRKKKLD